MTGVWGEGAACNLAYWGLKMKLAPRQGQGTRGVTSCRARRDDALADENGDDAVQVGVVCVCDDGAGCGPC